MTGDPQDFLNHMKKFIDQQNKEVIKTIEMKPEWNEMYFQICAIRDTGNEYIKKLEALNKQMNHLFRKFWAMIEDDTGILDEMRVSKSGDTIEIMGDKKEEPEFES